MNEKQMATRCPESRFLGIGVLKGYRLDFTISDPAHWGGGGCADVVQAPGSEVWGVLYEVTLRDIENLDRAEGQEYRRITKGIVDEHGTKTEAHLYEVVSKAPFKKPSSEYLNVIKIASSQYKFPDTYLDFLETIRSDEASSNSTQGQKK